LGSVTQRRVTPKICSPDDHWPASAPAISF
jgi:hypothetical protein